MKQITTKNLYKSTIQQWCSHQWMWRLNHHLEMVHTVSRNVARFTTWSHYYIEMRQLSLRFYIFGSAEATTKHFDWTKCCNKLTHLLSHKNECSTLYETYE